MPRRRRFIVSTVYRAPKKEWTIDDDVTLLMLVSSKDLVCTKLSMTDDPAKIDGLRRASQYIDECIDLFFSSK
jgi:hypothetical protein